MDGVAVFDYAAWVARYPGFVSTVNEALAQTYFDDATLFLDNTPCSVVKDVALRARLLGMLVAHLAQMDVGARALAGNASGSGGGAMPQLVGRVNSAGEGSVHIGLESLGTPAAAAFFTQTSYGLMYWQATAAYRSMRYIPNPVLGQGQL